MTPPGAGVDHYQGPTPKRHNTQAGGGRPATFNVKTANDISTANAGAAAAQKPTKECAPALCTKKAEASHPTMAAKNTGRKSTKTKKPQNAKKANNAPGTAPLAAALAATKKAAVVSLANPKQRANACQLETNDVYVTHGYLTPFHVTPEYIEKKLGNRSFRRRFMANPKHELRCAKSKLSHKKHAIKEAFRTAKTWYNDNIRYKIILKNATYMSDPIYKCPHPLFGKQPCAVLNDCRCGFCANDEGHEEFARLLSYKKTLVVYNNPLGSHAIDWVNFFRLCLLHLKYYESLQVMNPGPHTTEQLQNCKNMSKLIMADLEALYKKHRVTVCPAHMDNLQLLMEGHREFSYLILHPTKKAAAAPGALRSNGCESGAPAHATVANAPATLISIEAPVAAPASVANTLASAVSNASAETSKTNLTYAASHCSSHAAATPNSTPKSAKSVAGQHTGTAKFSTQRTEGSDFLDHLTEYYKHDEYSQFVLSFAHHTKRAPPNSRVETISLVQSRLLGIFGESGSDAAQKIFLPKATKRGKRVASDVVNVRDRTVEFGSP